MEGPKRRSFFRQATVIDASAIDQMIELLLEQGSVVVDIDYQYHCYFILFFGVEPQERLRDFLWEWEIAPKRIVDEGLIAGQTTLEESVKQILGFSGIFSQNETRLLLCFDEHPVRLELADAVFQTLLIRHRPVRKWQKNELTT